VISELTLADRRNFYTQPRNCNLGMKDLVSGNEFNGNVTKIEKKVFIKISLEANKENYLSWVH